MAACSLDITRSGGADGVADRDLIDTEIKKCAGHFCNLFFRNRTFIRTDKARRYVPTHGDTFFDRSVDDRFERIDRFFDPHVDIFAIECLRRCRENCDTADAACDGALQAFHVGYERGISNARFRLQLFYQILRIRELWNPFRMDERRDFNFPKACFCKQGNELRPFFLLEGRPPRFEAHRVGRLQRAGLTSAGWSCRHFNKASRFSFARL